MGDLTNLIFNQDVTTFDAKKAAQDSCIDLSKPIPPQPILVSCGSDWSQQPLCVLGGGDYSCIAGEGKSRKSYVKSALVSIYQGLKDDTLWPDWRTHREEGKMIIDIDTEQSDHHAQKGFRRVERMAGYRDDLYRAYALRKYLPSERMDIVKEVVAKYGSRIGLLAIDGYADLIEDTNDLIESQKLAQQLMTWTDEYQFHITGILHTNPGTNKMRGHLGSTVARKAATVINVKIDEDDWMKSIVTHSLARDQQFKEFTIGINKDIPFVDNGDPDW